MEWYAFALDPSEKVVQGKMKVHREEGVSWTIYPCSQFMEVAGIAHDFHTFLSNAGLERFVEDQPFQYAMFYVCGAGFPLLFEHI